MDAEIRLSIGTLGKQIVLSVFPLRRCTTDRYVFLAPKESIGHFYFGFLFIRSIAD